ncbi:MAG TPA: D-glycerate dehydrogenase [Thermoleophilaceae bacterium]|nr:D-glycerate dehydrogenase [Thermoleophilaceae bacterium]
MARVYVTRDLPGGALDRLRERHDVEVWDGDDQPPAEELARQAATAEGLLTMLGDRVDGGLLEAAPRLRAVANYAVGVDNVDVDAATARGIPVGHTPDVLTGATADMALALMLAVMRRLPEGEAQVREGRWTSWAPDGLLGRDLSRSTVLVVGRGRIGEAAAERVRGFGAEVIAAGRGDELGPLLEQADVVTLHCPLTDETRGLIGEPELRAMGPEAYLINTARGPVVDTGALRSALTEGWIAGAGLDVTDPEPLPGDHPLLEAPNLVIVPHLGSATHYTRAAMADLAVDNLLAALDGEPMPHSVNPEVRTDG